MLRPNCKAAFRLCCALMFITPSLTGCWDRLEVEQRATVLGLSIDTIQSTSNNDSKDEETNQGTGAGQDMSSDVTTSEESSYQGEYPLHMTAQIAVPGRTPLGPGEGGGGGGGSPQEGVWVLHTNGKTLNDALQRLQQQVADKLFLGHLRVIVVSEDFARNQGLEGLTDTLRRNPEVRRTAWLVVCKGNADEVMKTAPPLERVPALYLMSTMDHAKQMGKLPNDFLGIFESGAVTKGRQPVLPYVEVTQKDNINVAGVAYFNGYKMVDTTKRAFDIATYMELTGVKAGGYAMLAGVPGKPGSVIVQDFGRRKRIKVDIRNGLPHFTVKVLLDANIIGKTDDGFSLDNPQTIKTIKLEIEPQLEKNMMEFITQTKEDRVDIAGFGEYVRARQRRYWDNNIKTRAKWEEVYPKTTMDVHITLNIHRMGMKGM